MKALLVTRDGRSVGWATTSLYGRGEAPLYLTVPGVTKITAGMFERVHGLVMHDFALEKVTEATHNGPTEGIYRERHV